LFLKKNTITVGNLTQPEFPTQETKAFAVISPAPEEISRSIPSPLEHLHLQNNKVFFK